MAVSLEQKIRHFIADSSSDDLPRVGVMWEGVVVTSADLPVGSSVLYRDTGKIVRWNGRDWAQSHTTENSEALLSAILAELHDIKERIAIATA